MKIILITILLLSNTYAQSLSQVVKDKGVIWGFDFLSKDEIIYSKRSGELYYFNLKTNQKILLESPKSSSKGQGGLLDVLIHNKSIYLTYSQEVGDVTSTALAKASIVNNKLENLKTVFRAKVVEDSNRHFGSRLALKDNMLYMTVGDRAERDLAQDMSYHNGKILQFDITKKSYSPVIYSLGHRNPQGIDFDPVSKNLFSFEFGPRGGDELNLIKKGGNYGWPIVTHGKEYWGPSIGVKSKDGMIDPVKHWTPSISASGMTFYTGDKLPKWKNNLFLAVLVKRHLRRLVMKDGIVVKEEELFKDLKQRIRHVRNSPDGFLYFCTDSGNIYKIY